MWIKQQSMAFLMKRNCIRVWPINLQLYEWNGANKCFWENLCYYRGSVWEKTPRPSHHFECCNILWRCEEVVRVKYGHVSIPEASVNAPCCPFAHRGKIVDFKRFSTRGDSQFWLYFFKMKGCSMVSNSANGPLISNLYPCISPWSYTLILLAHAKVFLKWSPRERLLGEKIIP